MMRFRWQILIAGVGVVLVVMLILVLRGSGAPASTATKQAPSGGEYKEAIVGALQRLNPVLDIRNPPDHDVDRLIFSGLVQFDSTGKPIPDLAQGWVVSDEGKTYTVVIRPDAVWQDGYPVTAKDAVYTFSLIQDKAYSGRADLAALWRTVKVQALSAKLVQFTLPEPYAPFLDYLATGLLPEHLLSGVDVTKLDGMTFNLKPVGSGPFKVETLILNGDTIAGVTLVPFSGYYGEKPHLDKIDFLYYPTHADAFKALQSGTVMGLGGLAPEELNTVLQGANWNVYTARLPQSSLVLLNLKNNDVPFFQDREIRQALLMALDRQQIIDMVLSGQAIQAVGPILRGSWAADPNLPPVPFDPEEASRLLDAAGWAIPAGATPGTDAFVRKNKDALFSFTLLYAEGQPQEAVATAIQAQWAKVGVKVTLKPANYRSLIDDNLTPRTYQAALIDLSLAPYPDPDPYPFWNQTQTPDGQNYSQLDDRAISELLEEARTTMSFDDRARLYLTFQYRFAYQTPALFLWHPVYSYAVDARIAGIPLGPLYDESDRLALANEWYYSETK
jgi:peptide/nickel transport system substrate-binding protein